MKDVCYSSFIAGSTQTLFGHPFDTLKTFKQINPSHSIKQIYKNNINKNGGLKYLYRGSLSPLIGGCLQNSFIFSTEHITKNWINKVNGLNNPILNSFYSGFLAGGFTSLIISPTELIKCQQQVNPKITIKNIIKDVPIYRGLPLTFVRDSVGFGIYFSSYQFLQNKWDNPLLNGGIAGVLSWTYSYPTDVIKTKIQIDKKETIKNILKNMSFSNIKAGLGIMLLRAFVVNAGIFYTFETIKN